MSSYAKSVIAAVAAVLIAGVTSWQAVAADGFRLVDVLPVATAIAGAALTYLVPNVPELPWAKGAVSGALAVLTTLSTLVTGHTAEVDVANLLIAGLGALLTWYVPNLDLAPAGADGVPPAPPAPAAMAPGDPREIVDDLRELERADGASTTPWPLTRPVPAWRPPTPAAVAAEPTPIEAEAAAATTGRIPPVSTPSA